MEMKKNKGLGNVCKCMLKPVRIERCPRGGAGAPLI
ncbi:uncharacterized protein G2W53_015746 [Senna tora]|uniref:Uncharacterized protein n=1 Tax=Senna tora TaxID=362788 RepID=A0A834WWW9_9FABA|nr:uncharacterized protein G2W53_015746 [Senna tora]